MALAPLPDANTFTIPSYRNVPAGWDEPVHLPRVELRVREGLAADAPTIAVKAPVPAMRHGAPSWAPPAMLPTSGVDADPASTSMAQRLVFDMPSTLSEDTAPSPPWTT